MQGANVFTELASGAAHAMPKPPKDEEGQGRASERLLKEMKHMGVQIQRACTEEIRAQGLSMVRDMKREFRVLIQDVVHSNMYIRRRTPSLDGNRHDTDLWDNREHFVICTPPQPPPTLPVGMEPPGGDPLQPPPHLFSSALKDCDDAFVQPPLPWFCEVHPPLPGFCEVPHMVQPPEIPPSAEPPQVESALASNFTGKAQSNSPWKMNEAALLRSKALERQADAAAGGACPELEKVRGFGLSTYRELEENEREPGSQGSHAMGKRSSGPSQVSRIYSANQKTSEAIHKPNIPSVRRLSLGMHRAPKKRMSHVKSKPIYQMTASELLSSTRFDNMIGCFILLNAATIGWQADYAARNVTDAFPDYFITIERVFCMVFSVELCLRMYVQKLQFWCGTKKSIAWNYFDLVVVSAQLLEEVLMIAASSDGVDLAKIRLLRILRILRLVRILRVIRVLHLISELRTIISSILGSVKSLGWTVILLSLIIYIVGVYFTNQITDYLVEKKSADEDMTAGDTSLTYYFGSLGRALLSLWQAMSGGADWDAIAAPLIGVHPLLGVAFAMFIAFALLALMNVVTGVFVQTALQNAKEEEDIFLEDQVMKLFEIHDREKKTRISLQEIEARLGNPETAMDWKAIDLHPTEAKYLFDILDIEECGEIGFDEFLGGCLRIHGNAKSYDLLTVMQEHRSMVRAWSRHREELHEELGDLRQQIMTTAHLTNVCSTCIQSVMDMLGSSRAQMHRMEVQMQQQESALGMIKCLGTSVDNLQSSLNQVAGLPPGGFPAKPTPGGRPQVSRPVEAVAEQAGATPITLYSDSEEEV